ncbi:hypothetical protein K431DRAFT_289043 [Polychaeton citri CBS 116435]|uniref:Uncharacterized protein n=1 Tax=Polychaeton citri CBS 116435 TaxID=1314669 RepID=A0A9P4UJY2_9PEZI|nr:hypothetical protein K431DRAFT_289043 [Polychaeton citri CBS 116435]
MSLTEAYRLAHSAECRLAIAAKRPDRDLRVVVGHLIHYESLRLRIVEIEHNISQSQRASAVKFRGAGDVSDGSPLQPKRKPSSGQLGRRSPPPAAVIHSESESDDTDSDSDSYQDEIADGEGDIENLVLERYPTGSTRELDARQPPPLEADQGDDADEEDELPSPEDPDDATLAEITKGECDDGVRDMYDSVTKCPCHGRSDAPEFEKMWALPIGKDGKTRAVAAIA